jgi:hypothetical protein
VREAWPVRRSIDKWFLASVAKPASAPAAMCCNANTRRVYKNAVKDFMRFVGIARPEEFRTVTRALIIAWRDELAGEGLTVPPYGIGGHRSRRCSNIFAKIAPLPITR